MGNGLPDGFEASKVDAGVKLVLLEELLRIEAYILIRIALGMPDRLLARLPRGSSGLVCPNEPAIPTGS